METDLSLKSLIFYDLMDESLWKCYCGKNVGINGGEIHLFLLPRYRKSFLKGLDLFFEKDVLSKEEISGIKEMIKEHPYRDECRYKDGRKGYALVIDFDPPNFKNADYLEKIYGKIIVFFSKILRGKGVHKMSRAEKDMSKVSSKLGQVLRIYTICQEEREKVINLI